MNGFDVERQVIKVFADYYLVDYQSVEINSRLVEDLGVDSIDLVEITMLLNEKFDVDLPASEIGGWRTVAEVCHLVQVSVLTAK